MAVRSKDEITDLFKEVMEFINMNIDDPSPTGEIDQEQVVAACKRIGVDPQELVDALVPLGQAISVAVWDPAKMGTGLNNLSAQVSIAVIAYLAGVMDGREQRAGEADSPVHAL